MDLELNSNLFLHLRKKVDGNAAIHVIMLYTIL